MAEAGLGVAALLDFTVSDSIKAGLLVPLLTDYSLQEGAIYVARPPGRIAGAKTCAFVDVVVDHFGAAATNERTTAGASAASYLAGNLAFRSEQRIDESNSTSAELTTDLACSVRSNLLQ